MKLARLQPTVAKLKQPMQEWKPWQRTALSPKRLSGRALQTRNARIKLRDKYTCQVCKRLFLEDQLEIDHLIPLAQGGGEQDANLQSICKTFEGHQGCHAMKTARENAQIAASR